MNLAPCDVTEGNIDPGQSSRLDGSGFISYIFGFIVDSDENYERNVGQVLVCSRCF